MAQFHLAQLNLATMKEDLDSPLMAEFVANLERINALAEQSPGFVWRLVEATEAAGPDSPFGAKLLANLSVWQNVEALRDYAFRSAHVEFLRRRREWFERMDEAYAVLWWIPAAHRPTLHEAAQRLQHLRQHGATAHAFGFAHGFAAPTAAPAAASAAASQLAGT